MKRSTSLPLPSMNLAAWRTMALGALIAGSLFAWHSPARSESAVTIPAPTVDEPASGSHQETIVLAGGCFWGVQGVFAHVKGVTLAVAGYSGGSRNTAHYEEVGSGDTGHAESVQITFDPAQVSYGRLLQIYFSVVQDPTQLNAQGPDSGTQYRSAIFPANDAQRRVAQSYIAQLDQAHVFSGPIVTKVEAFKGFYPAEHYHQDFLTLHPDYPYIVINDLPKVDHLKTMFPASYRAEPALAASKVSS
jgi:peptide-methionine (S)-S-oxide reductase